MHYEYFRLSDGGDIFSVCWDGIVWTALGWTAPDESYRTSSQTDAMRHEIAAYLGVAPETLDLEEYGKWVPRVETVEIGSRWPEQIAEESSLIARPIGAGRWEINVSPRALPGDAVLVPILDTALETESLRSEIEADKSAVIAAIELWHAGAEPTDAIGDVLDRVWRTMFAAEWLHSVEYGLSDLAADVARSRGDLKKTADRLAADAADDRVLLDPEEIRGWIDDQIGQDTDAYSRALWRAIVADLVV